MQPEISPSQSASKPDFVFDSIDSKTCNGLKPFGGSPLFFLSEVSLSTETRLPLFREKTNVPSLIAAEAVEERKVMVRSTSALRPGAAEVVAKVTRHRMRPARLSTRLRTLKTMTPKSWRIPKTTAKVSS